jgi:hypothetical protein
MCFELQLQDQHFMWRPKHPADWAACCLLLLLLLPCASCREQNSLADRLAQMSMDIDTALHALLRKGEGGVAGLQLITKAARLAKRQVGGWLQQQRLPAGDCVQQWL